MVTILGVSLLGLLTLLAVVLWCFRQRLMLLHKLMGLCLGIGIGGVGLAMIVGTQSAQRALMGLESEALQAIANARGHELETYFNLVNQQLLTMGQASSTVSAIEDFSDAFAQLNDAPSDSEQTAGVVRGFYQQQIASNFKEQQADHPGTSALLPTSPAGLQLQRWYLTDNTFPTGNKHKLDAAPASDAYNTAHAKNHPDLRAFLENFGFYDLFLFDTQGNMVYSVYKEIDFATNFLRGPHAQSTLGKVVKQALASNRPGPVHLTDFAFYKPSYDAPAIFAATPIFSDGKVIGCLAYQMPVERFNDLLTEPKGLSETGNTFLVGSDGVLRSQDRFETNPSTRHARVRTEQLEGL